jgi:hypothetical protein
MSEAMVLCDVQNSRASRPYLKFESSNGWSKLLNIIFILKYTWRLNYIFFENFC